MLQKVAPRSISKKNVDVVFPNGTSRFRSGLVELDKRISEQRVKIGSSKIQDLWDGMINHIPDDQKKFLEDWIGRQLDYKCLDKTISWVERIIMHAAIATRSSMLEVFSQVKNRRNAKGIIISSRFLKDTSLS